MRYAENAIVRTYSFFIILVPQREIAIRTPTAERELVKIESDGERG
jgi:hypothetical protein